MNRTKAAFEAFVVYSRWLVAPFLVGLVVGLVALLVAFVIKLVAFIGTIQAFKPSDVIVGILNLVDLTLTANLLLIVIFSSFENFLTPIHSAGHPDWPEGLVKIGFSGLKQKLLGSIVAIAAVSVLEWFMDLDQHADNVKLAWVVGILIALAVTTLVLAVADRVGKTDHGD